MLTIFCVHKSGMHNTVAKNLMIGICKICFVICFRFIMLKEKKPKYNYIFKGRRGSEDCRLQLGYIVDVDVPDDIHYKT